MNRTNNVSRVLLWVITLTALGSLVTVCVIGPWTLARIYSLKDCSSQPALPPAVCEFNVTVPPAICEFNVTVPPAVCETGNTTCQASECRVFMEADLPITLDESGCWVLGEDIALDSIQRTVTVLGGLVDINFAGHTVLAASARPFLYVSGIGTEVTAYGGIIRIAEQSSSNNSAILAFDDASLTVRNMRITNYGIGISGSGAGRIFAEDCVFEGITMKKLDAFPRVTYGVTVDGPHAHVNRCRFEYPLAPDVVDADELFVTSGIRFRQSTFTPTECGLWTIENSEILGSAPIIIDSACPGSRIERVIARIDTTEASPSTAVQLCLTQSGYLCSLTIDHLTITGSARGQPGTAALAMRYNMRTVINDLQSQVFAFEQIYVDTADSQLGGIDFETRVFEIRDSTIRPSVNGRGIFLSGGSINTHFLVRDTSVEGFAWMSVFINTLAKNVVLENVDIVDGFTCLSVQNYARGVRVENVKLHRCCLGAFVDVLAEDVIFIGSEFFNNVEHNDTLLSQTTVAPDVYFGQIVQPFHCVQIAAAEINGYPRVKGPAGPLVISALPVE